MGEAMLFLATVFEVIKLFFVFALDLLIFAVSFLLILINVLLSAASLSGSSVVAIFGPAWNYYKLLFEGLAWLAWFGVRLFFPTAQTVVLFLVGLNLANLARSLVRFFKFALVAYLVLGVMVGSRTWIPGQSDVMIALDKVDCETKPFIVPIFDIWTATVDFLEPILQALNKFLVLVRNALQFLFDGLVRFVIRYFELLFLTFAGGPSVFQCNPSIAEEFCAISGCIPRQWMCFVNDVVDWVIVDIVGTILAAILPDPAIHNILINVMLFYINAAGLIVDMALQVFSPTSIPLCVGTVNALTVDDAFNCYIDRTICVPERVLCGTSFWYQVMFGSYVTLAKYIFGGIDLILEPAFGFKVGTLLEQFLGLLQNAVNFLGDSQAIVEMIATALFGQPIMQLQNTVGWIIGFINALVANPLDTLSSLPNQLLNSVNVLQVALVGIFGDIGGLLSSVSHLTNLVSHLTNLVSHLTNIINNLDIFRRRRLLSDEAMSGMLVTGGIPLELSEQMIRSVQHHGGYNRTMAQTAIVLIEVYNQTMHTECGLSDRCVHMLSTQRMEDQAMPDFDVTQDALITHPYWTCVARYMIGRRYCAANRNMTTTPEFHLATMSTLLPEHDVCKAILEDELLEHIVRGREHGVLLSDAHALTDIDQLDDWWLARYLPCSLFYTSSFSSVYNNETGIFGVPDSWETELFALQPGSLNMMSTLLRMSIQSSRPLPALSGDEPFLFRAAHAAYPTIRGVYAHTSKLTAEEAEDRRQAGIRTLSRPHRLAFRKGAASLFHSSQPDHIRLQSTQAITHELRNFPYYSTLIDPISGALNRSLHFHYTDGFTTDRLGVERERERLDNAPGLRSTMDTVFSWFRPLSARVRTDNSTRWRFPGREPVNPRVAARRRPFTMGKRMQRISQNTVKVSRSLWYGYTTAMGGSLNVVGSSLGAIRRGAWHITKGAARMTAAGVFGGAATHEERPPLYSRRERAPRAPMGTARRLEALGTRDFDFTPFANIVGDIVFLLLIVSFRLLSSLAFIVSSMASTFLETFALALEQFDVTDIQQFLDLLETVVNYISNDYVQMALDSFQCDAPNYVSGFSNPTGDWKVECLLSLKLPGLLPRPPPNYAQDTIPWFSPCLDTRYTCSQNFPGQLPCAEYQHCRVRGFMDGFDDLVYMLEKYDYTGLLMPFLRAEHSITIPFVNLSFSFDLTTYAYIGPLLLRFEDVGGGFPEGPEYDGCLFWTLPSAVLPFIVMLVLGVGVLSSATKSPQLFSISAGLIGALLGLPFAILRARRNILNRYHQYDVVQPVFAEVYEPNMQDFSDIDSNHSDSDMSINAGFNDFDADDFDNSRDLRNGDDVYDAYAVPRMERLHHAREVPTIHMRHNATRPPLPASVPVMHVAPHAVKRE